MLRAARHTGEQLLDEGARWCAVLDRAVIPHPDRGSLLMRRSPTWRLVPVGAHPPSRLRERCQDSALAPCRQTAAGLSQPPARLGQRRNRDYGRQHTAGEMAACPAVLISPDESRLAPLTRRAPKPIDGSAGEKHTCLASLTEEVREMPVSVSVRLPDKTAQALDDLASATERPRTYLIVKALEAYLADHADYQVALDRLMDKDDPVISSGELRRRLGRKD